MKQEIFKIMSMQHEFIASMLDNFEESHSKDLPDAKETLNLFVWNLEKHIFLEEKILYSVYSIWEGNIEGMFEILGDHGDIMVFIKKIKSSDFNKSDISLLKEILENHFSLEETVLYPNLEKVLNSEQKKLIIERAQEIIRG
jgi:hemerythrin-like domain-containing protein